MWLNNKHCVFNEWRSYYTDSDRLVDFLIVSVTCLRNSVQSVEEAEKLRP
jgi:hypothetical protein